MLRPKVNKPSLRSHYIGLHSESTTKRTAAYAALVCFQKATESGGRFLVADGAAILAEIDTKLVQKLYDRQIRISVSNLDLPPGLPGFLKEGFKGVVDAAVAPKFDMDLEMMFEADGKPGRLHVRMLRLLKVLPSKSTHFCHLSPGCGNCGISYQQAPCHWPSCVVQQCSQPRSQVA
jgi:hypothetical protein